MAIEGRYTGLYAWLLGLRNIDPLVSFTLTDEGIAFRRASLIGFDGDLLAIGRQARIRERPRREFQHVDFA